MPDVKKLRCFETWIDENGLVQSKVIRDSQVAYEDALEQSAVVLELCGDTNRPLIVDIREIKSITHEAREHFSIKDRETKVTSIALVIKSPLSKVIGNFFLGINQPKVPTRLFTGLEKANEWSLGFLFGNSDGK